MMSRIGQGRLRVALLGVAALGVLIGALWLASPLFGRGEKARTRKLLRECAELVWGNSELEGLQTGSQRTPTPLDMRPGEWTTGSRGSWPVACAAVTVELSLRQPGMEAMRERLAPQRQPVTWMLPPAWQEGQKGADVGRMVGLRTAKGAELYLCIRDVEGAPVAMPRPPNSKHWVRVPQPMPPAVMDAWGNPLILVPGGELIQVTLKGKEGEKVRSPDGKGFFASAGPDGNFREADDNLYSFE